jgi:hypothetical protein
MKKIQLYLLLCVVIFSTGCPSGPSKDLNGSDNFANRVNAFLVEEQNKYYQNYANNRPEAKRIRDDLIDRALAVIDSNYNDFITRLQTRRSTTDFIADVIDLGLGAATGISKGERPNQILGIVLTAFRGGRRSAELNFYREQTTPILISKMDDNRAKVERIILEGKEKEVTDYSLPAALRDIVAYYNAGTLVRAFTELSKDTAAQAQRSEKRVLELKNINPSDIVNLPEASRASTLTFADYRRALSNELKGTEEQKKAATENLRLIYQDLAGSANFDTIRDDIKKERPALKAIMDKLESDAEEDGKSVAGMDILKVLSAIFTKIDLEKQPELATEFTGFFDKRLANK